MPDPPHDSCVDPDDYDQEMANALEHEAGGAAERCIDPAPHGAPVLPFARRDRPETGWSWAANSVD